MREWCAAIVWISSHTALTADGVVHLSIAQRGTLGAMLEVDTTRCVIETSGLLVRTILDALSDTFLSIMVAVQPDLATMSRAETDDALNNTSFNYDPADLGDAREACALKTWLRDAFTTADDFKALPENLRDWARMLHGVNSVWDRDTIATTVPSLVDKWKASRRRRSARPVGAVGAPQPPPHGGPPPPAPGLLPLPGAGAAAPNLGGAPPPHPFPSPNAGGALFRTPLPSDTRCTVMLFPAAAAAVVVAAAAAAACQRHARCERTGSGWRRGASAAAARRRWRGSAWLLPVVPELRCLASSPLDGQRAEGQRELDRISSITVQFGNLIPERERKSRIHPRK